jgi:hypothetical protein
MTQFVSFQISQLSCVVDLRRWVARVFSRWKFTSTDVRYRNVLKFTAANVAYYLIYTHEILSFPQFRLKFFDEASFEQRSLMRRKGRGFNGQRINAVVNARGDLLVLPRILLIALFLSGFVTYTVSLLTSLTEDRGWAITAPRLGSNDAFAILGDIAALIIGGHLEAGDLLVSVRHTTSNFHAFLAVRSWTMRQSITLKRHCLC